MNCGAVILELFQQFKKIRYFHKNIRKLINYKKIKNENSFFEMKNLLKKNLIILLKITIIFHLKIQFIQ